MVIIESELFTLVYKQQRKNPVILINMWRHEAMYLLFPFSATVLDSLDDI